MIVAIEQSALASQESSDGWVLDHPDLWSVCVQKQSAWACYAHHSYMVFRRGRYSRGSRKDRAAVINDVPAGR